MAEYVRAEFMDLYLNMLNKLSSIESLGFLTYRSFTDKFSRSASSFLAKRFVGLGEVK